MNFTTIHYYNTNVSEDEKNFSEDIFNFCNIHYIFYEPFQKNFYNKIFEIIPSFQS